MFNIPFIFEFQEELQSFIKLDKSIGGRVEWVDGEYVRNKIGLVHSIRFCRIVCPVNTKTFVIASFC